MFHQKAKPDSQLSKHVKNGGEEIGWKLEVPNHRFPNDEYAQEKPKKGQNVLHETRLTLGRIAFSGHGAFFQLLDFGHSDHSEIKLAEF